MNVQLRYGFDWDRAYFIDFSMQYQLYMPLVTLFFLHPIVLYLLIFENKTMRREIRVLYLLTHIACIISEWTFFFGFRIWPVNPFAALYCEGPLCRAGINKQILAAILCIPTILITSPFTILMARMHQMFLPQESRWKLPFEVQIILAVLLNVTLIANVAGFGYFGRDHDNSEELLKEPELAWLANRKGTLFVFGPPGDPQYFRWALLFTGLSILIIAPFILVFSGHAMATIAAKKVTLSSKTQGMAMRMFRVFLVQSTGALICNSIPLMFLFSTMLVDVTFIPDWLLAPSRFLFMVSQRQSSRRTSVSTFPMIFTLNSVQFCVFFVIKSPAHRKILSDGIKHAFAWRAPLTYGVPLSPVSVVPISVSSRHEKSRF